MHCLLIQLQGSHSTIKQYNRQHKQLKDCVTKCIRVQRMNLRGQAVLRILWTRLIIVNVCEVMFQRFVNLTVVIHALIVVNLCMWLQKHECLTSKPEQFTLCNTVRKTKEFGCRTFIPTASPLTWVPENRTYSFKLSDYLHRFQTNYAGNFINLVCNRIYVLLPDRL